MTPRMSDVDVPANCLYARVARRIQAGSLCSGQLSHRHPQTARAMKRQWNRLRALPPPPSPPLTPPPPAQGSCARQHQTKLSARGMEQPAQTGMPRGVPIPLLVLQIVGPHCPPLLPADPPSSSAQGRSRLMCFQQGLVLPKPTESALMTSHHCYRLILFAGLPTLRRTALWQSNERSAQLCLLALKPV